MAAVVKQIVAGDIVVGLDGSRSAWRALDWAAEEAEVTGAELVVVHAHAATPEPGQVHGADLLSRAVTRVGDDHPGVRTTARLFRDRPDRALLADLDATGLVVLGRGASRRSRTHLGTTARRVLGHAPCPAVIVDGVDRLGSDSIVVGVSVSAGGLEALRFAGERALHRGSELVAVRGLDADVPDGAAVLDAWMVHARRSYPDVAIRPVLASVVADAAIECEAMDAGLVVLGCHRDDAAKIGRLGVLTSALAREVSCPVVVVGHPHRARQHVRTAATGTVAVPSPTTLSAAT